ncbi:AI-2E family transporter [Synechococcus elongatus]|uniref:AI-2E family transporter n=1 Tax=Synechococcus elongatus PCC 11802 TaxID=2283154 RepID=A0AAT9JYW3_SYNEL|nr:AI-2E family transporter [Synechococcus elongatus]QFZ92607.1 AI-2E family transporter [Synechococcus elongatus PCC 11802]
MSESDRRISLTTDSLLLIVGLALVLLMLWQLRGLILILMSAIVLAASIAPIVNQLEAWRFPRWLGVLVAYGGLLAILTGASLLVGPLVISQIETLLRQLPNLVERVELLSIDIAEQLDLQDSPLLPQLVNPQEVAGWVINTSQQLLRQSYGITRGIVGGFFSVVLGLLLSSYLVADSKTLGRGFVRLFAAPWDDRLAALLGPVGQRMGAYIRGRVLVSLLLGIAITLGLRALGLGDYAIGLGAIAGFTNLIPFLGPFLGAIPALFVALAQGDSAWLFLWVLLLFVIIQNLESYVLDPLLVGAAVGIHPLYQLLAVLGGVQLLGIVGAVIAPPWIAGAALLLERLYLQPKDLAKQGLPPEASQP